MLNDTELFINKEFKIKLN